MSLFAPGASGLYSIRGPFVSSGVIFTRSGRGGGFLGLRFHGLPPRVESLALYSSCGSKFSTDSVSLLNSRSLGIS